jgi:hypothetical protein
MLYMFLEKNQAKYLYNHVCGGIFNPQMLHHISTYFQSISPKFHPIHIFKDSFGKNWSEEQCLEYFWVQGDDDDAMLIDAVSGDEASLFVSHDDFRTYDTERMGIPRN